MGTLQRLGILLFCVGCVSAIQTYYMDVECGSTISFTSELIEIMRLRLTMSRKYSSNMDCTLILKTSYGLDDEHFLFSFKKFDVEATCDDYLEVRDGSSSTSPYVTGLYGKQCSWISSTSQFRTSGRNLYLRFKSDDSLQYSGFEMMISKYHTGVCYSFEHRCSNGRCIDSSLVCNGYNPCGDNTDCDLSTGAIVGAVLGGTCFVVIVVVVVVLVRRRRMRYVSYAGGTPGVSVVSSAQTPNVSSAAAYNQPVNYAPPAYPTGPPAYPTSTASGVYPTGQQYPPPYSQ